MGMQEILLLDCSLFTYQARLLLFSLKFLKKLNLLSAYFIIFRSIEAFINWAFRGRGRLGENVKFLEESGLYSVERGKSEQNAYT